MDKTLKFTLTVMSLIILTSIVYLINEIRDNENSRRLYCGKVVQSFISNAGYDRYDKPYVVFYSDSLKKNIAVQTSWQTFVNKKPGDTICFNLSNKDLK